MLHRGTKQTIMSQMIARMLVDFDRYCLLALVKPPNKLQKAVDVCLKHYAFWIF